MKETTLAYLAGLIDGEGYVGIKKGMRHDSVSPLYHERIQVRMVHEDSIKLLKATFGGNYYCEKPTAHHGRPLFCWQSSDLQAAKILQALLPYLVIKRQSALTVLSLRELKDGLETRHRQGQRMSSDSLAARERLYLKAKALNHAPVDEPQLPQMD